MKRKTKLLKNVWIILLISVIIFLPTGIKMMLKIPLLCNFLSYGYHVEKIIDIYVPILSAIGTLFLGYVACRQNEVTNMQNERLIKLEEISRKVYIELNKEQSKFVRTEDGYECDIYGKNISRVPITDVKCEPLDELNNKNSSHVKTMTTGYLAEWDENTMKLHFVDLFIEEQPFVFCFKLSLTGLYGYKTVQVFNIVVNEDMICKIYMSEEEKDSNEIQKLFERGKI